MNQYRYFVESTQVYPTNDSNIRYKFEKKIESAIVLDIELDSSFEFKYNGAFNFKTQEETNRCQELNFKIERRCGNTYTTWFEGIFSVSEGEFDDDKCLFVIKPRKKREILDDLLINILDTQNTVSVKTGSGTRTYTNGRNFSDVLLFVAQKSNPKVTGIISDFFQINPINVSTDCLPGVTNYYKHMVFAALSDIQEPIPSNLATREVVTFRDLMDDLNALFDVYWFIDSNYKIRIEHRIFFDGVVGIDLTQAQYSKYINGTNKYTYTINDYVKEENWKIADHQTSTKLIYGGISNIAKSKNEKTYATSVIRTDYYNIRYVTGGESKEGIFLFATDGAGNMLESGGQNEKLTPYYLVQNIHTYGRPDLYAILISIKKQTAFPYNQYTGGGITLKSKKATKEQVEIEFPLCCDEVFDTKNKIKTPMGDGELESASFESQTNLVKVKLKYPVNNCSSFVPTDISGMQLWLKFNEGITLSGGNVTQWNDFSGNGRHAVQATAGNMPLYNALTGEITFNTTRHLKTPAFQLLPGKRGTILTIQRVAAVGAQHILSTFDGSVAQFFDFTYNGASLWNSADLYYYTSQNTYGPGAADGLYVTKRIADAVIEVFQNGAKPANFQNPYTVANTQPASKPLVIGYNANNNIYGTYGSMVLKEVMIYDKVLTDEEIELIQLYLTKLGTYTIT